MLRIHPTQELSIALVTALLRFSKLLYNVRHLVPAQTGSVRRIHQRAIIVTYPKHHEQDLLVRVQVKPPRKLRSDRRDSAGLGEVVRGYFSVSLHATQYDFRVRKQLFVRFTESHELGLEKGIYSGGLSLNRKIIGKVPMLESVQNLQAVKPRIEVNRSL